MTRSLVISLAATAWCSWVCLACEGEPQLRGRSAVGPVRALRVAARDLSGPCLDVGEARACWPEQPPSGADCKGGVCRVPRPTPARSSFGGFRCSGSGNERACEDRARFADPFLSCSEPVCEQRFPRLPDDGEWECVNLSGVSVCHGGVAAAGVIAGPGDPGFVCGARRGHAGERVCVDLSPDLPPGAGGVLCSYLREAGRSILRCTRVAEPRVGGDCSGAACPAGSSCVSGVCLPDQPPQPACWLDADCRPKQMCRFGSCREAE